MTCFRPLDAWRRLDRLTEKGKSVLVFNRPAGPAEAVRLACGQCVGCRIDKSREWALRCIHEASLYDDNCFVTLTYSDEQLPENGSLVKGHHQRFMKDLRKRIYPRKVRFLMCGEYGSADMRPHYHFLLFGYDFVDKVQWRKNANGDWLYRSPELEWLWTRGYSLVGDVTWQSAAYVARYALKKVNGEKAVERYCRDVDPETGECRVLEPEYICMSRRPGIGYEWYQKFKDDCRKDFLTAELGKVFRVPAYYDKLLGCEEAYRLIEVRRKRKERAKCDSVSRKRLVGMEHHKECQLKRLERSI